MPRLIMRRGPEVGRVFELNSDVVVIGRGAKSEIVVNDNEVSRAHCRFIRVMQDYELHDLGSANGTFVNGQRVHEPWLLQNDCIIELGDMITFQFERTGETTLHMQQVEEMQSLAGQERETEEADTIRENARFIVTTIASRPDEQEVFILEEPTLTMGRDLSNRIVVQEPEVSRFHLRFTRMNERYAVEDLGSTNGTLLNGDPLEVPQLLNVNDTIQIGTMVTMLYTDQPGVYRSMMKTDHLAADETYVSRNPATRPTREAPALLTPSKRKTTQLTGLKPGELENHVFIAYAREEWEKVVASLTVSLQDAKLNVWVEQYLKPGNNDWVAAVEQALTECWAMIVIVSPLALVSKNVGMQYRYFYNRERPIVPLIYPQVATLPPELARQRSVRYDAVDPSKSYQRLVFEIMQLRKS
jgi:pSer/pThr/pTyr-binding forkhead associated (FHA) protein